MHKTAVVVVDVQERLFAAMEPERRDEMVANVKLVCHTARRLGLPILLTEQYPKGLGSTLPEVRALLPDVPAIAKTSFSCCGAGDFVERLRALDVERVVLAGIEAHVCVLLTALDLLVAGYQVSIVADATCSRRRDRQELGLAQARQAGAVLTATETFVFQQLGSSDHAAFRELSKLLR